MEDTSKTGTTQGLGRKKEKKQHIWGQNIVILLDNQKLNERLQRELRENLAVACSLHIWQSKITTTSSEERKKSNVISCLGVPGVVKQK